MLPINRIMRCHKSPSNFQSLSQGCSIEMIEQESSLSNRNDNRANNGTKFIIKHMTKNAFVGMLVLPLPPPLSSNHYFSGTSLSTRGSTTRFYIVSIQQQHFLQPSSNARCSTQRPLRHCE